MDGVIYIKQENGTENYLDGKLFESFSAEVIGCKYKITLYFQRGKAMQPFPLTTVIYDVVEFKLLGV